MMGLLKKRGEKNAFSFVHGIIRIIFLPTKGNASTNGWLNRVFVCTEYYFPRICSKSLSPTDRTYVRAIAVSSNSVMLRWGWKLSLDFFLLLLLTCKKAIGQLIFMCTIAGMGQIVYFIRVKRRSLQLVLWHIFSSQMMVNSGWCNIYFSIFDCCGKKCTMIKYP